MPSKRKQVKKIKRTIKRKVQQHRAAAQQQEDQQQQLLKLMSILNAGRGVSGSSGSMDPAAFLNNRETAATAAKRERDEKALAKREEKFKEKVAKYNAETTALNAEIQHLKEMFGIKEQLADAHTQQTAEKRRHDIEMLRKKLQQQGVSGEHQKLLQDIAAAKQTIALNTADGSIDETNANIEKLKKEFAALLTKIDFHNADPTLKKMIEVFNKKLEDTMIGFNKTVDLFHKHKATDKEIQFIQQKMNEMAGLHHDTINMNHQMEMDLKNKQNQLNIAHDAEKEFLDDQRKHAKLKRDLERTNIQLRSSELKHDVDAEGNLIEDYSHKFVPEIKVEDIPEIDALYSEYGKMSKWLDAMIRKQGEQKVPGIHRWPLILTARFGSRQQPKEEYTRFKEMYDSLPDDEKYPGMENFEKFSRVFMKTFNEWKDKHDEATKNYDAAVRHNDELRANAPKVAGQVSTAEAIAIIDNKIQKLQDVIESTARSSNANKKLQHELEDLIRKRDKLQAQVNNTPEPVLSQDDINKHAEVKNQVEDLERKEQERRVKQTEINRIKDQTAKQELQNQVEAARLDGIVAKQSEQDAELEKAIEAQVAADQKQRQIEAKRMTNKAEAAERQVNMTLNAMETERFKAAEEDIVRERAKATIKEHEVQQREQLAREKYRTHENIVALESMKMVDDLTRGSVKADDLIGQLKAVNDKVSRAADQYIDDRDYVRKKHDEFITRLDKDPNLHLATVNHFERFNVQPFQTPEDLRSRLDTREKVDNFGRLMNGLARRSSTPPSMSPGRVYRFYRAPNAGLGAAADEFTERDDSDED